MNIQRYLRLAADLAILKDDKRHYRLGAVGIRTDGVLVAAANGHPKTPDRRCHAEYRLTRKLDKGSTVFVSRVLADGSYGLAKPCQDCMKLLKTCGVRVVYWSVSDYVYGSEEFQ